MDNGGSYHHFDLSQVFTKLNTSQQGLTDAEATQRLKQYGLNRLTPKQKVSAWSVYLSQFKNALTIILLVAAGLIFFVWYFGERDRADLIEGILVVTIVFLITILGFFQEWKAEKAVDALKKLLAFKAKVLRGGKEQEIDVSQLVPGDVVILEEGTKVPADIRLIEVASLSASEASLTGESVPVHKITDALEEKLQLGDQKNMVFSGTVISQGRGLGVVVRTGDSTEIGKIATAVSEVEEEQTPIQKRLDTIGRILGYTVLGIAAMVFVFIFFFATDFAHLAPFERIIHSFIAAVALAVAAIPEGLPAVVTISLALGTQRMLKRKALVRKLNSIETLGSTDVICSDKTGTLTKGEMTVREIYFDGKVITVSGAGYETKGTFLHEDKAYDAKELNLLLTAGLLCNNAVFEGPTKIIGDPTEVALLVSAIKANTKASPKRVAEEPFNSERKLMSVVVHDKDYITYTKGAPEKLLTLCHKIMIGGKPVALTADKKKDILDQTQRMSEQALRTLGFAYKSTPSKPEKVEHDLIFIGLQGMIDPPRTEVKPLIAQCHASGIRVIMITGDHAATAEAVAHEIGIEGKAMSGEELDACSPAEFSAVVKTSNIYARVNPNFKMRIIEVLKKQGHIVAMTGDGVNDAPALKRADIGVAMGITGTDVAKESSDMVLMDDKFTTIISAIEEGRGVYDNIRKFVNYLLSSNIGEVLIVFAALALFQDVPLTATMLLWINVVTDGLPAVALGMDPAEKDIMQHSPKKFQGEIIPFALWIEMFVFGVLLTIGVLTLYAINIPEGFAEARSAAFFALVIFELVRLFHIRMRYNINLWSNTWLIIAVAASLVLQCIVMLVPFVSDLFQVQAIDLSDWLLTFAIAIAIFIIFELIKPLLVHTSGTVARPVKPVLR